MAYDFPVSGRTPTCSIFSSPAAPYYPKYFLLHCSEALLAFNATHTHTHSLSFFFSKQHFQLKVELNALDYFRWRGHWVTGQGSHNEG